MSPITYMLYDKVSNELLKENPTASQDRKYCKLTLPRY